MVQLTGALLHPSLYVSQPLTVLVLAGAATAACCGAFNFAVTPGTTRL